MNEGRFNHVLNYKQYPHGLRTEYHCMWHGGRNILSMPWLLKSAGMKNYNIYYVKWTSPCLPWECILIAFQSQEMIKNIVFWEQFRTQWINNIYQRVYVVGKTGAPSAGNQSFRSNDWKYFCRPWFHSSDIYISSDSMSTESTMFTPDELYLHRKRIIVIIPSLSPLLAA